MRINNNISAIGAYNRLNATDAKITKNLEKLSSGLRINRAADDAAGLTISESMRAQIKGLTRAVQNVQDGVNLLQTAEGALNETHSILQRMNELATQAANDTNSPENRANIQKELAALSEEVDNIAGTEFNGIKLLTGSGGSINIQIGAKNSDSLAIGLSGDMRATNLGVDAVSGGTINVTTFSGALAAMSGIQAAIDTVSSKRVDFGALQNRFDHKINNLNNYIENLTASESRIRDVDMAKEMAEFTKNQILSQAGTSMLAQANQKPQAIMQLLQG